MKYKGKIWAVLVALVVLLTVAATYFGSVATVDTMHATTNGIHITLGEHQASVVRKISPSNLVAVQNTVLLPRTNSVLYLTDSVANYASAATIILDCTFSKTHVVTQALASHVSVIVSNYAIAGRDFSFYCYGANAATNNNLTWSLSGAGAMEWANSTTNISCLSNGWVYVSGSVPMAMTGLRTNVVLNYLDQ